MVCPDPPKLDVYNMLEEKNKKLHKKPKAWSSECREKARGRRRVGPLRTGEPVGVAS